MIPGRRIAVLIPSSIAALAVVPLAIAFACSPEANIALSTVQGAPGSQVTVVGDTFSDGRVEISVSGRALGVAPGPEFRTTVTLPDLSPGVHVVTGTGYDAEGDVAGVARQEIQVGDPSPAPDAGSGPVAGPPAGGGASAASPGAGPSSGQPSSAPGSSGESVAAGGPAAATKGARKSPGSARSGASRREGTGSRGNADARQRAGGGSRAGGRVVIVPQAPATVRTGTGQRVFGASVAPARSPATPRSGARRPSVDRPAASVTSPQRPGERQARGASLIPSDADPAMEPQGGAGLTLAAGAGLMGLGLVLMLGGFLVVEVRRRRAPTHSGRR